MVDQSGIRSQLDEPAEDHEGDSSESDAGTPDELVSDLERLGPTFVKLGQMLSTRGDLLPPAILGALIIGASLMMRMETSLTLFGYPAIAMGFFLTAGIAGLILVFRMMFSDEYSNSRVWSMYGRFYSKPGWAHQRFVLRQKLDPPQSFVSLRYLCGAMRMTQALFSWLSCGSSENWLPRQFNLELKRVVHE